MIAKRCHAPILDVVGVSCIALYSTLLVIFKETEVKIEVATRALAVVALFLGIYSAYTLKLYCKSTLLARPKQGVVV